MHIRTILGAGVALAALMMPVMPAKATPLLGSGVLDATIGGTTFAFGAAALPWNAQIFSFAGQCLVMAVTQQGTDLKLVASAPGGTVWRDDDGGPGLFPLIVINPTPNTGYYTVAANQFAGAGVDAAFTIRLRRLPAFAGICATPTPALLSPPGEQRAKSSQ